MFAEEGSKYEIRGSQVFSFKIALALRFVPASGSRSGPVTRYSTNNTAIKFQSSVDTTSFVSRNTFIRAGIIANSAPASMAERKISTSAAK